MLWERRSAALDAVRAFVAKCGGGLLSAKAADRYGDGKFDIAWRVWADVAGSLREFHILIDGDFPYSPPRVAMPDAKALAWPHVEKDGGLCVLPSNAAISVENPAAVVCAVLKDARALVEKSMAGSNEDDFRCEFLSYWRIASGSAPHLVSIVEPRGPSRVVCVHPGERGVVVGDDQDRLITWMRHRGVRIDDKDTAFTKGALLWLPEPLLPREYPATAAAVRLLAEGLSDSGRKLLGTLTVREPARIYVLLGANTPNGACFGAVRIDRPQSSPFGGPRRRLSKGFRPGHVAPDVALDRHFAATTKVVKQPVDRADHLWIHGRDRDERQHSLRTATVAVLGCGSLGSTVARLLAQAGVGNLLLIDPALMDWRNVGRHSLGGSSVARHKADALAEEIARAYPHMGSVCSLKCRFGPAVRHLIERLAGCDLIVSTMGNWAGESFLNELQHSNKEIPTIVYGWLEARALAAHSVVVRGGEACLRCGVDDCGRPAFSVVDWPNESELIQAPACGSTFSPYGPAELCWAHGLVTEAAIGALTSDYEEASHRVWIGHTRHVQAAGGRWTERLTREVGDVGQGGLTIERRWPAIPGCPVCHR